MKTDPNEFIRFHTLLMKSAPLGYYPYYFPLNAEGKDPIPGVSWKKNRKDLEEAVHLMRGGYNIGIAGTADDVLCIVDVDDLTQVTSTKPTLKVTSRKRIGEHNYYFALDGTAKKNIPSKNAGEVRSVWQYVLAPGSYVPCSGEEIARIPEEERENAGKYTVSNDLTVSEITFDEFPEAYKKRYAEMRQSELDAAIRVVNKRPNSVPAKFRSALWDLDITDVSGVGDTRGLKIAMPSEIHGSETGHNCSVGDGLLHCWRHYVAHNAFSYLCVLAGFSSCEQAGKPHGGRSFGVDFQDGRTVFEVWKYAKNARFIPENDPIPHSALIYYALSRKLCKKKDIVNGKLSDTIYQIALLMGKREGMEFGR